MAPGAWPDFHSLFSRTSSRAAPPRTTSRACSALILAPSVPSAGPPPNNPRRRLSTVGLGVWVGVLVTVGSMGEVYPRGYRVASCRPVRCRRTSCLKECPSLLFKRPCRGASSSDAVGERSRGPDLSAPLLTASDMGTDFLGGPNASDSCSLLSGGLFRLVCGQGVEEQGHGPVHRVG